VRIDKLLWFLRLAKTRGVAQAMAEEGHIRVNGRRVDRAHGQESEQRLDADRVNAIRAALASTDWASLPSRLC